MSISDIGGLVVAICLGAAAPLAASSGSQAEEPRDAPAQYALGLRYYKGDGMAKQPAEAVKWYRRAADHGYAKAQNSLGVCYHQGKGVPQDAVKAVKWYRQAADQGFALAQANLGICYATGAGVAKNPVASITWYRKAAAQGCASALVNLGNAYCDGNGVTRDYAEAVMCYRQAAKQGDAAGQHGLGLCYYRGEGVKKDDAEAIRWYRKAAAQGHAKAQNCLGDCYAKGEGVAKNPAEAVAWWRLAAAQGELAAQASLAGHDRSPATAWSTPPAAAAPQEKTTASPATGQETTAAPAELFAGPDEVAPCILPLSETPEPVKPGASWALGLGTTPGPLLNALAGGRAGGDVTAMMVLLRQAGGPLSDAEDQAMNKTWAPYAAAKSPTAHRAIRRQSELLLQSMVNRQIMVQAAWEYDFAIAQQRLAQRMNDPEEARMADRMAELQRQVAENAQKTLVALSAQIDQAPEIPTPEQLKAAEDADRKNAVAALGLGEGQPPKPPANQHPYVGKLKYEGTTWVENFKQPSRVYPGTSFSINLKKQAIDMTLYYQGEVSWSTPAFIPIYANSLTRDGNWDGSWDNCTFPFSIKVKNTGSKMIVGNNPSSFTLNDLKRANRSPSDTSLALMQSCTTEGSGSNDCKYSSSASTMKTYRQLTAANDAEARLDELLMPPGNADAFTYIYIVIDKVFIRYKWEPAAGEAGPPEPSKQDARLNADQNSQIAEHEAYIAAAKRALTGINRELDAETEPTRRETLRFQRLHLEQDIHDSNDLIESIRTGTTVSTRGPWDEHATAVMARTSMELAEECQRARQMQASFVRLTQTLEKYQPEEARRLYETLRPQMAQGVYGPGGMDNAKKALAQLYGSTRAAVQASQQRNYADLDVRKAQLERAEWNLAVAEGVKRNCDRAIFAGTLFTGMAPGLALNMVYEGACTTAEKGPKAAIKNAAFQGGIMLASMGAMKVGGWAIGKFLNPKVAQSEVNSFKNLLESNRYQQEMEWNQALVNRLKEKAGAMEKCQAAGGADYLKVRAALDDAVVAANSSSLAKNIMKNELVAAEKVLAEKGGKAAATALNDVNSYQNIYNKRLQGNIYPRTDAQMVTALRRQGYNVEPGWFREFRNATSRGANRDRDLGLIAQFEGKLTKNGQPASLNEFMADGQKAYNSSYKQVTGRSAVLADQNITTTAHNEAFPLKWLEQKVGAAGDPRDFDKAGSAIYNKVKNAMAGPDPAFVNLKKACSSLAKDLKTKVLPRLEKPLPGSAVSATSRQAAMEHWNDVQKVMESFASDKIDPLTAVKKLQQLTGSTSVTQSAAEVQRLLGRLGGAVK